MAVKSRGRQPSSRSLQVRPAASCKAKVQAAFSTRWYTVVMTLMTLYALFGDDIRLTAVSMAYDNVFFSLTTVVMGFFLAEVTLLSYVRPGYFLGFYFWLDLLSTLSLIFDIGWIMDAIEGTNSTSTKTNSQMHSLSNVGRGARVGTRAGRIARIVQILRVIRVVKLYKHTNEAYKNEINNNQMVGHEVEHSKEQSQSGQKLAENHRVEHLSPVAKQVPRTRNS